VSDPYQYYKSDNDAFKITGFALSMQGFGIPAAFSSPDILYKLPLTYGDADSSFSGTEMEVEGTGYLKVERKRVNTVDGWGTLTTPYGTFEVIRVKSYVDEYDSIYIDSQETGIAIPYSYTEYKWLAKSQKVPLLTIRDVLGGVLVEYTDSIRGTLGVPENKMILTDASVFPNPVHHKATVRFNLKQKTTVSLSLLTIEGKQVYATRPENFNSGEHTININLEQLQLPKGIYFVNLNTGTQNQSLKLLYLP
jgi:hypothetical protein